MVRLGTAEERRPPSGGASAEPAAELSEADPASLDEAVRAAAEGLRAERKRLAAVQARAEVRDADPPPPDAANADSSPPRSTYSDLGGGLGVDGGLSGGGGAGGGDGGSLGEVKEMMERQHSEMLQVLREVGDSLGARLAVLDGPSVAAAAAAAASVAAAAAATAGRPPGSASGRGVMRNGGRRSVASPAAAAAASPLQREMEAAQARLEQVVQVGTREPPG